MMGKDRALPSPIDRTPGRSGWMIVAGLVIVAGVLRFSGIEARSLWGDEIVCLAVATGHSWYPWTGEETELFYSADYYRHQLSLAPTYFSERLISLLRVNDQMPPFYYVLVNLWLHLFGTSEAAVRSLSLLASVGSVPLLYALGRQISSHRAGIISASIFALAPFQIAFALYNRPYALLGFLALLSTLAAVHLSRGSASLKWLLLHAAAVILGVYTHYLFVWNVVFQVMLVVYYQRHNRPFLLRFGLAYLGVAAACLAWAPVFLAQMRWSREVGINSWFYWYSGSPSLTGILSSLSDTLIKLLSAGRVSGLAVSYAVPLLLFGLAAWRMVMHFREAPRRNPTPDPWGMCLLWAGCVFAGPVIMDVLLNSHMVYSHRYFISASGPVYLAVAMAVVAIPQRFLRLGIGAGLGVFLLVSSVLHLQGGSATLLYEIDARAVAQHIDERAAGTEDLILVMDPGFNPQDFAYYLRSNPDFARVEVPEHRASAPDIPSQLQAVTSAARRDTIWFFDDRGPETRARTAVLDWLRTHYVEVEATEISNLGLFQFSVNRSIASTSGEGHDAAHPCARVNGTPKAGSGGPC